MSKLNMNDYLILEWINIYEQCIQDYQSQHKWNEQQCVYAIWNGIMSTKYLNLYLIEKCIILLNSTSEIKKCVCSVMSRNPALTMEMVLVYPELKWNYNVVSKYILIHSNIK